jgi:hypothetical protein
MAFKPQKQAGSGSVEREFGPMPVPKAGPRKARVSLIVDLGIQEREPFDDGKGNVKEQKPCQQVAVFVDLVNDVVDYGGNIGKKQYRLMLNRSFAGDVQGINFVAGAPRDADGELIPNKPWGFHPASLLTKLCAAVGRKDVAIDERKEDSLNIKALLGLPLQVNIEVKETEDKNGKKDKDGNVIVYKNVNNKGLFPVPLDDDDNPQEVKALETKALCISFDDANVEDIVFIRPALRKMIKQAKNYAGSAMQAAIEAFEATHGLSEGEGSQDEEKPAKQASKPQDKAAAKAAKAAVPDDDEDAPF